MMIKKIFFSVVFISLFTTAVFSQTAVRESFEYPLGSSMDTLLGTAGNGWGSPWELFEGNEFVMEVADSGIVYDDLNYSTVPHVGNQITGANPSAWGMQRYGRYLSQTWPNEAGKVYWLSCLINLGNYSDNGWALVSLYTDGNEGPGIGHEWGNQMYGVATYNDLGRSTYSCHDGPQWLVAKVVMTGDTLGQRVYLWVTPDPEGSEPDTTVADARGNWNLRNGFNRVAVHWGGETVGMTMSVDEIRLGTSWADVSGNISIFKVRESFEYPLGSSLDTLLGTAGNGWGSPWELFEGNEFVMEVADSGIVYDDLNYSTVPHVGNQITGANPSAWGMQRYGRYLSQTWPNEAGKVYWLSCLINLGNYSDNGWALVSLYTDGNEGPGIGHEWGNQMYGVATYNDLGRSTYSCHDGPQWLVAKVVMTGDTLGQRVYLWVTPDPEGSEPDTTVADARGNWNLRNGFNRVAVHWGGETVGMTMSVDEIRLGTSWADVSESISDVLAENNIPINYYLSQNYPNPFNPSTKINYTVNKSGNIRLTVYDVLGREVATLVNEEQSAGEYTVDFKATGLTSGVYFYKLQAGDMVVTKKMMLLK